MRRPRRAAAVLSLSLVAGLGLVGCGGDDEGGDGESGIDAPEATASPAAQIESLSGVDTTIAVQQEFADAITGLGLSAGAVGSGRIAGSDLVFPITGGRVTYYDPETDVRPHVRGTVEHAGAGLSFSAGGTTVELTDPVVDPGQSLLTGRVTVNGKVAAESANLFFLDGRTLEPLQVREAEGTAVLTGTQVRLHPDAAAVLTQTFMTEEPVPEYLTVGTATITLALPAG